MPRPIAAKKRPTKIRAGCGRQTQNAATATVNVPQMRNPCIAPPTDADHAMHRSEVPGSAEGPHEAPPESSQGPWVTDQRVCGAAQSGVRATSGGTTVPAKE